MNGMTATIIGMFLVIIGGIAGLYYKLGCLSQVAEDHSSRITRVEEVVFPGHEKGDHCG